MQRCASQTAIGAFPLNVAARGDRDAATLIDGLIAAAARTFGNAGATIHPDRALRPFARRPPPACAAVVAVISLLAASGSSHAATATGSMAVSATVLSSCTVTPGPLAFGNYDPTSATPTDATAAIIVICTAGTAYTLGLDAGAGSGAAVTNRKLTLVAGASTLNYAVYNDSGRSVNWGNTSGTGALTGTSSLGSLTQTFTAYGRIPAGQSVSAGAYADTVTVTLTY